MSETDTTDTSTDTGSKDESSRKFTQDDITRIATREKDEGKRAGSREVLETLGFSSLEDAKNFKAALDKAEADKLSDVDRARKEADAEKAAAQKEKQEARQDRIDGWIESALTRAGVTDDDDLAMITKMLDVDYASANKEDVTKAVKDLRERKPKWFESSKDETDADKSEGNEDKGKKPPSSDPGKEQGNKPPVNTSTLVRSRLEARHGSKLKPQQ